MGEQIYILSYSLIIFKIKFVRNTDLSHSEGPVIIHLTGWVGYKILSIYIWNNLYRR